MTDWLGLEMLMLSDCKPKGYVPKPAASLLERIKDHGPIEPVVVRRLASGKFEILANPETWVAAGRVGLHEVPVLVRDDVDDDLARDIVRSHYIAKKRNPIDEARHFEDQLEVFGGRQCRGAVGKLSRLIGRPRPYIVHSLRLLSLPAEIQTLIEQGNISAGQARPLVTIPSRQVQIETARTIVKERLSARAAEKLANKIRHADDAGLTSTGRTESTRKSVDVIRFERAVSEALGATFVLEDGKAVIDYFGNFEVLQGIVERLGYRTD